MKFLVVFVCFVAAVHGLPPLIMDQIKVVVGEAAAICRKEVGAGDDDVAPLKVRKLPTTHEGKCFLGCMQKKFGMLDQSGRIDKEGTYAMIDKVQAMDEQLYGQLKHVAEECLGKVKESPEVCDTAFHVYKCVRKEANAVGIEMFDFNF